MIYVRRFMDYGIRWFGWYGICVHVCGVPWEQLIGAEWYSVLFSWYVRTYVFPPPSQCPLLADGHIGSLLAACSWRIADWHPSTKIWTHTSLSYSLSLSYSYSLSLSLHFLCPQPPFKIFTCSYIHTHPAHTHTRLFLSQLFSCRRQSWSSRVSTVSIW